jgi:hypothetical protein
MGASKASCRTLAIKISMSTIGEVLREAGIQPSPTRGRGISYKEFVRFHAEQICATDLAI